MKIEEKSCGCIVIENRKVLLIKQTSGIWGFPKGHVEHDETEEETAKREVKEETNIDVEIDPKKRYEMHYTTDKGKYKEVVLFLSKKISGQLKKQDDEILEAKWFEFDDAMQIISFENTKELFEQVLLDNYNFSI